MSSVARFLARCRRGAKVKSGWRKPSPTVKALEAEALEAERRLASAAPADPGAATERRDHEPSNLGPRPDKE